MSERLNFVADIARHAGKIALEMRPDITPMVKNDGTIVTQADIAIQKYLTRELTDQFPDHQVMAEESGGELCSFEKGRSIWVVDPIDGTDSYRAGLAYFCISIGLLEKGQFTLGVIYLPVTDEMYCVDAGEKPALNGVPISASDSADMGQNSFLAAPSNFHLHFESDFPGKVRSLGSTAHHMALVAAGRAVGAVLYARLWDVAAGIALVNAASGKVSRLCNVDIDYEDYLNGSQLPMDLLAAPRRMFTSVAQTLTPKKCND